MQIIELRFIDGLMNYQIAARLNVSTRTVKNDLRFAYRAISRGTGNQIQKVSLTLTLAWGFALLRAKTKAELRFHNSA